MALVLKDRVREQAATTGTGTFTLSGSAYDGYRTFASCIPTGSVVYYCIHNTATGFEDEWEVGYGTFTLSGNTLSRTSIMASSNAGAAVDFSAGTKEVFITYPAEKAIYEETNGETLIDGGPITVVGSGVTVVPALPAELGKFVGNVDLFAQIYNMNQSDGSSASADFVAYNDLTTDGYTNFIDMGINSSTYTSVDYPIFTPGSGYLFHDGDDFFIGNQTAAKDVVLFAGGADTTNEAVRIKGADQSVELASDLSVAGTATITGAAEFQSTVLLDADPTLALQAATKQYVDNQVTAGLHLHEPVLAETTGNLTATYAQGGTTFNITDITGTNTVTTSASHGLSVGDQIWLYTSAGNGLSTNTAYFVYSVPAANQLTLSLTFSGAQITGLTNASGLTYATRANSGVGATLTNAGAQSALTVDGVALSVSDRVMVRLQTTGYENGVYTVTTVGDGSTNWVLTRATDSNKVNPADPNGVGTGDYYYTQQGTLNAGDSHVLTTEPNTMILGYTTLTFTQFSGAVTYTGGTNIDVTGQTISLTGTVAATNGGTGTATVTTGDLLYGSGTNTWGKLAAGAGYKPLVMNAGGTAPEWNALALNQSGTVSGALPETHGGTNQSTYTLGDTLYSSAANTLSKLSGNTTTTKKYLSQTGNGSVSAAPVWAQVAAADISGLAASATTDTTNAANISSGTLPSGRLSGSYTGITGVGTLTAGTWTASTVGVAYGGTGKTSYTTGDIVYASASGTLASLADVATGNALISGGVGVAPSYGKIGLTTHITGTLAVANGGTGATTLTGYVYGNGTGAMTASTSIPNSATTATSANTASAIVARDASGNFSAGTITATLSGNASTATSATDATNAANVTLTTSATASAFKVPFANTTVSTTGNYGLLQDSAAEFTYNPSTNTLTVGTVSGALSGNATTSSSCSGNAATATALQTARTINGTSFNGTANITVTANTTNTLTLGSYLTGGSFNGSAAITAAVDATSANTASKVVARDASGNFSAGTITAALSGNATTATTLATARTIALSGAVTGTATSFNGSANITIPTTVSTTQGGIVYGASTTAYGTTAAGTSGYLLASGGTGAPAWVENSLLAFPGSSFKKSVRVATTAALTLNTAQTTIDGVTIAAADRVLVKNQATAAQNGIYSNLTTTSWTRTTDADTSAEIAAAVVAIDEGTTNGGTLWTNTFKATDTLGTTAMNWYEVVYNSGTWAISVSGSAATLTTARTINGVSFNGSANITVTANTTNTLTLGSYLTGTSFNGSAAVTAAVDATSANTASKVVARDASGNFSAGTITATLSGNASTATTATTANALNTSNNYQVNSLGVGTAGSGTAGEIRATNNITAYYSDDRLKTKLGNIENALDKVDSLAGFYYEANEVAQALGYEVKKEVGVSAQSVQAVMPEVVAPAPIDEKYLTVRYERLVPLLIEAIKELRAEVKALKGE